MPCKSAMTKDNIINLKHDNTIKDAINLFSKYKIRSIPIVDEDEKLLGVFSIRQLLLTILPIPDDVGHHMHSLDISLNHLFGQSEWLAERLQKHLSDKMSDCMIKEPKVVHLETQLGEGARLLAFFGSPVFVTDKKTNKVEGLISSQSIIKLLLDMDEE